MLSGVVNPSDMPIESSSRSGDSENMGQARPLHYKGAPSKGRTAFYTCGTWMLIR